MKLESDFEGLTFFLGLVLLVIGAGVAMHAFYGYGYFAGRSDVLDSQVCVPREKAK